MARQYVGNNYENLVDYCKFKDIDTIMLNSKIKIKIKEAQDWAARLPYPSYKGGNSKLILFYLPINKYERTKEFKKILGLDFIGYKHDKKEALISLCDNARKELTNEEMSIKNLGFNVIRI